MNILFVPVIFIFVLLAAYVTAGSFVRYQRGIRTCPEMLPNYVWWKGLCTRVGSAVMGLVTCGRHNPLPERVVTVMPQMPVHQFRRDTHAFHQLPGGDDLDDDDFGPNEPSVPVQVRY